jgi:Cu+-exporting ATPase
MQMAFETLATSTEFAERVEARGRPQALDRADEPASEKGRPRCFHCGALCRTVLAKAERAFCCQGCLTVFELLTDNGLGDFYKFGEAAGVRVSEPARENQFKFLDEPAVRGRLVDFANERVTRVTFRIPAIHCIACVWLLENLCRLKAGVGQSQVNFPRKEVAITFETGRVRLSEIVALLASLGYEPELKLSDLEAKPLRSSARRLWMQLGVAGFAFGNIMLFSIASYCGLDAFAGPGFRKLVGYLSLVLAIPVVAYSASDYWRAAWVSVRQRLLNIDVPIAVGIAALFGQSVYEVVSGRGEGYFDSLAGLLFFLLCGKLFQRKTYDRLAFDRDFKAFFPLSVTRLCRGRHEEAATAQSAMRNPQSAIEERISLSQLQVGDRLIIRNGELIPADARLVEGRALIDYSFVTGEADPVGKQPGDCLYAGGRQIGAAIDVETVKPVSQSYLTSLWNQEAFRKEKGPSLHTLTNRYSQRFTKVVMGIAVGAAMVWAVANPAISLTAFVSVLIVACPCALALAAPFALGTAQRILARLDVYLKNPGVIETLAGVDTVVFDKTGTLTAAVASSVAFRGAPLSETEERWIYSLTRHSTHPHAVRIGEALAGEHVPDPLQSFRETTGQGIRGHVGGHEIRIGSAAWLEAGGIWRSLRNEHGAASGLAPVQDVAQAGGQVHVAIDGQYRGCFELVSPVRPNTEALLQHLSQDFDLALLSGDNEKDQARFSALFGPAARLHFNQSPMNKLRFIRELQESGKAVMMVGDGLNDAGALKQSDVGVAVVEKLGAFSPASDVIMAATMVPRLAEVLRFAKQSVRVVQGSFLISAVYNVAGISIAASGLLSPVVCAILMPLSSVTVVAFACGATTWLGRSLDCASRAERRRRFGYNGPVSPRPSFSAVPSKRTGRTPA